MYMISVGFSAILVPDMCRICVGYVPDSIDFDQCEGTYLTNLIVPAIRASLKNLPHGKFTYIST